MKQIDIYDFQQYDTIRSFADIYTSKISINEAEFIKNWKEFNKNSRPRKKKI